MFRAVLVTAVLLAAAAPTVQAQDSIWTVHTTVQATVQDGYAIVDTIVEIGNRGPDPEFPFQVLVPERAMVSGLWLERDGEVWTGRIEDKAQARQEYEEQKTKENTAALAEKTRGTQVFAFLVNVAEFQSVTATLRYEMLLQADQDVYELPLLAPVSGFGQDLGARFETRICDSNGVATAAAAGTVQRDGDCFENQYSVGPRPDDAATEHTVHFTLPPTPHRGDVQSFVHDGVGYFLHRFRAPADAQQLPLDLTLVLDTSGSMGSQHKMEQLQDAATQVVGALDDGDRLQIVLFDSVAEAVWEGLGGADDERRAEARQAIAQAYAAGGTNIEQALQDGFAMYAPPCDDCAPRSRVLVFLTDGQPSIGLSRASDLREMALEANPGGVRLFALAFGSDADWGLVAGLARDHGGSALLVPHGAGAEVDLRRFMDALTTPVLEDVRIEYDGAVEAFWHHAPVLFQGSELLVVGTFDPSQQISGTVTGTASDGPRTYPFDETVGAGHEVLVRIVAHARIQHYEALINADGEGEWKEAIRTLALQHGFVTDYTSLVLGTEIDDPSGEPLPYARVAPGSSGTATDPGWDVGGSASDDEPRTPLPLGIVLVALLIALRRRS